MRSGTAFTLGLLSAALFALPAAAVESVQSRLSEQDDSGVGGTATFSFTYPDTRALVEVKGLDPGAATRVTVHVGGCSRQGASFVALSEVAADADGNATADGLLLFQGSESIQLETIADGEHSISVRQGEKAVACGAVPKLREKAAEPEPEEASDAEPPWILFATIATVVILLGAGVLAMKRRKT